MTEVWEMCREANRFVASGAFLFLCLRSPRVLRAEWAKPRHVEHYRTIVAIACGFLLAATWSAYYYTSIGAPATGVSGLLLVLSVVAIVLCIRWPAPSPDDDKDE